jgi:pimeloyl-ACP methyl ester carboxylesterase
MFLFGKSSPWAWDTPAASPSPAPRGAPTAAPPSSYGSADPSTEALAARGELGAPFVEPPSSEDASSVGSILGGLFRPVEHLAESAGHWLSHLFGGDDEPAQPAPAPAAGSAAQSGWAMAGHEDDTPDVTDQYKDLVARAKAGENTLPDDASQYAYLMVPGLVADKIPTYLDPNLQRMQELGLDAHMAHVDSGAGVDANADELRDEINKIWDEQHRQVVLTGQSMGGVDITAALAKYPELADHVRAVVAMQAPYGGTPLADGVEGNPITKRLADDALTGIFGGDPRAIQDLTYESRQQFVGEHPYPADQVPTVSLATSTTSQTSPLTIPEDYMRDVMGLPNDGMVPTADEVIPGSDVVRLDNMDHAGSNMNLPFRGNSDSPGDVTEALLTLALAKAQQRDDDNNR